MSEREGGYACQMNCFNIGELGFLSSREAEKDVADRGPRWFRWVLAFPQKSVALRTFNDVRAPVILSNLGVWVSLREGEHWSCPLRPQTCFSSIWSSCMCVL